MGQKIWWKWKIILDLTTFDKLGDTDRGTVTEINMFFWFLQMSDKGQSLKFHSSSTIWLWPHQLFNDNPMFKFNNKKMFWTPNIKFHSFPPLEMFVYTESFISCLHLPIHPRLRTEKYINTIIYHNKLNASLSRH